MPHPVKSILIVGLLKSMARAISLQGIGMIAYGLENQTILSEVENLPGLKVIPRSLSYTGMLFDNIRDVSVLSKLIREDTPDIVHVNALRDLLPVFIAVHFFSLRKNRPAIVAMAHNPLTWKNPRGAWLAAKFIQYLADGFVALSTTNKLQLIRLGVPEKKLTTIPNPYDPEQIDTEGPISIQVTRKGPRVIYVGSICERKAPHVLILAASIVLKNHPDVKFDFIGGVLKGEEKYAERIRSLANELNIRERVCFLGPRPYREIGTLLANSDIFALPTYSEMMPRAVVEAMVAGKPVVVSAVDGILDLIQDEKNGLLVQPGNAEELAAAICRLIDDPALATELGLAGRKYVLEFCSPERVGSLFREFYQLVICSTPTYSD